MPDLDPMLTRQEVMEWLRISNGTLRKRTKAGDIVALRIGRAVRYRKSEIEAYLARISDDAAPPPEPEEPAMPSRRRPPPPFAPRST